MNQRAKEIILGITEDLELKKEYTGKVIQHTGEIILVGISYDAKTKKHTCIIEMENCNK